MKITQILALLAAIGVGCATPVQQERTTSAPHGNHDAEGQDHAAHLAKADEHAEHDAKGDDHAGHEAKAGHDAKGDDHAGHGGAGDLKTIMGGLREQMTAAQAGLWTEDFDAIAAAGTAIADHPHVGPEEMMRVKGTLGARMKDFGKADKVVHDAAVRLAEVAKSGDLSAAERELSAVQAGCVACHEQFRAELTK